MVEDPPANAGDAGSIPGSGRFPGGGHGNPLQCSCLENPHEQRSLVVWSIGLRRVGHGWSDLIYTQGLGSSTRPVTQWCEHGGPESWGSLTGQGHAVKDFLASQVGHPHIVAQAVDFSTDAHELSLPPPHSPLSHWTRSHVCFQIPKFLPSPSARP